MKRYLRIFLANRTASGLLILAAAFFISLNAFRLYQVKRAVDEFALKYEVDPALARDIAYAESSFNPSARGPDGGLGLYQFMPKTWAWATAILYGAPLDAGRALDLKTNAEVGVWFISWISEKLKKEGAYSDAAVIYCFNSGIGKFRGKERRIPARHSNRVYDRYFREHGPSASRL